MDTTTANTMERKVVVATYTIESVFKIPKGLDLEDKTIVKQWYVKWDTLYIEKVDGTQLEVCENSRWGEEAQKHAEKEEIKDADDYCMDDDSDEDE